MRKRTGQVAWVVAVLGVFAVVACSKRQAAPPASWEPDRSCTKSDECTPAPSCCPVPCNSNVINKKDVTSAQARVDAECSPEKRKQCPQAGSCPGYFYGCIRAKCTL